MIVVESEVRGSDVVRGRVARCDDPGAAPLWTRVRALLERGALARPDGRPVTVHLAPRARRELPEATHVEVHEPTGDVLSAPGALETDDTIWLHELTHARLATGVSPRDAGARAVARAMGEAAGDFVAAAITGRAVVGSGGVSRDLRTPPRLGPEGFAALASGKGLVTVHASGWDLAAALYADASRRTPAFRAAFLRCFDAPRAEDDAVALVRAFVAACPPEARTSVRAALREWAPASALPE